MANLRKYEKVSALEEKRSYRPGKSQTGYGRDELRDLLKMKPAKEKKRDCLRCEKPFNATIERLCKDCRLKRWG